MKERTEVAKITYLLKAGTPSKLDVSSSEIRNPFLTTLVMSGTLKSAEPWPRQAIMMFSTFDIEVSSSLAN